MSQCNPARWLEAKNCVRNRKHLARYQIERWHEWDEGAVELGSGVQHVRTFIGTWNLCGRHAPADISSWVRTDIFHHVYAIGTCECERGIGESLVFSSKKRWEKQVAAHLGDEYVMIKSETLGATHLMVFIVTSLVRRVRNIRTAHVATGLGNLLGNKGATEVSFSIGTTRLLFINAHLTCGATKVTLRTQGFARILKDRQLVNGCVFEHFDHVFFFGDLNYRLQISRDKAMRLIETGNHEELLRADQLLPLLHAGAHVASIDGVVRALSKASLRLLDDSGSDSSREDGDSSRGVTHQVTKKRRESNSSGDTTKYSAAARNDAVDATKKEIASHDVLAMLKEDTPIGNADRKTHERSSADEERDGATKAKSATNNSGGAAQGVGASREDDVDPRLTELASFQTKVTPAENALGGDAARNTLEPSQTDDKRNGAMKKRGASSSTIGEAERNGPPRERGSEATSTELASFQTKITSARNALGGDVARKTNESSSAENERDGTTKTKGEGSGNNDAVEHDDPWRVDDAEPISPERALCHTMVMPAKNASSGDMATKTHHSSSAKNERDAATTTPHAARGDGDGAEDRGTWRESGATTKGTAPRDVHAMSTEDRGTWREGGATTKGTASRDVDAMSTEDTLGDNATVRTHESCGTDDGCGEEAKTLGAPSGRSDATEYRGMSSTIEVAATKDDAASRDIQAVSTEDTLGDHATVRTRESCGTDNGCSEGAKTLGAPSGDGDATEYGDISSKSEVAATKNDAASRDIQAMSTEDTLRNNVAFRTNESSSVEMGCDKAIKPNGTTNDVRAESSGAAIEEGVGARSTGVASLDAEVVAHQDALVSTLSTKRDNAWRTEKERAVRRSLDAEKRIRDGSAFGKKDLDTRTSVSDFSVSQLAREGSWGPGQKQPLEATIRLVAEFSEMPIEFPPTYKFDIGTNQYDSSGKRRVPSYTDRVLWKSKVGVRALAYDSVKSLLDSDHRPIFAQFELEVNLEPKKQETGVRGQSSLCEVM